MSLRAPNPAALVIDEFGGIRPLARALGLAPVSVLNWKKHRAVPPRRWTQVFALARKRGMRLTLADIMGEGK
jgi:hypothetical protein